MELDRRAFFGGLVASLVAGVTSRASGAVLKTSELVAPELSKPNVPLVYDKFLASLKAAGISVPSVPIDPATCPFSLAMRIHGNILRGDKKPDGFTHKIAGGYTDSKPIVWLLFIEPTYISWPQRVAWMAGLNAAERATVRLVFRKSYADVEPELRKEFWWVDFESTPLSQEE